MKKFRLIIVIASILISLFGILMITSSSYVWASYKFNDPFKYTKNQFLFFLIGLVLMYLINKVDYHIYYKKANMIFLLILVLLILVLIPGIGSVRNGSRSWFEIGPFGIQPSEFMKIALIIFISKYMTQNRKKMKNFISGILPILFIILFTFFIVMLEPDFGSGFIMVVISIGLLFVGGVDLKFFYISFFFGIAGIVLLIMIAPYRLSRILSFLNPWSDPLGSGFQMIQSLYSIGPGGLFGLGLGNSIQKHFYLPEPQTDFIFSIISEELGFMGILILSTLFILIIYSIYKISKNTTDLFGKYISFGIAFYIGFQSILNLMVVVGLIPVTGVTLPFLSYGGSSLLITLCSMGIILNISKCQR